MDIPRQHRLDPVPGDLRKVGVVEASGAQVRDVAVTTLVAPNVWAGGFLGWEPGVSVEVALSPEAASWGREEQLPVVAIEPDLGFQHPGEGCRLWDDAAGVGLAVVGLGALEECDLDVTQTAGNAPESLGARRNASPP